MHLSLASPKGGEGEGYPGLMWELCELYISKFLYFPTRGGLFSCKVPSIWRSQAPNRTLFWFFEQLANTRSLHSVEN